LAKSRIKYYKLVLQKTAMLHNCCVLYQKVFLMGSIASRISRLTRSGLLALGLASMGTPGIAQTQTTPTQTFADAAPREVWTAIPGFDADPHWSEDFYAVRRGAVRPRMALWSETTEEKAALDAAWEAGIRTYLRRVSATMGGMNHPDAAARDRLCAELPGYLHPHFIHTEGRRDIGEDRAGGFVFRTRDQLLQACRNRAFRLTGFALYAVSGWVMADRRTIVVEACYVHNQFNDPRVRGVDTLRMNGRPVVPRIANETISIGADGRAVIEKHWAVDSDLALVLGGCRAGLPAD
jgi:hypothetical protein